MSETPDFASMFGADVITLRIELLDVKPKVWREIVLDGDMRLPEAALAIEAAMGWESSHLHVFRVGHITFGPDVMVDEQMIDEYDVALAAIVRKGTTFEYDYDFGDGWSHAVTVVSVDPAGKFPDTPLVTAGERACPPEDCGGPWEYLDMLAALADPAHERHEEVAEWMPEGFDPARFNVDEPNRDLAGLGRRRPD